MEGGTERGRRGKEEKRGKEREGGREGPRKKKKPGLHTFWGYKKHTRSFISKSVIRTTIERYN